MLNLALGENVLRIRARARRSFSISGRQKPAASQHLSRRGL